MSTLTIRKKSLKTWLHTDSVLGDFIISKFYFNADNVSFQIVEQGQSRRVIYNIIDITLYALPTGGTAETFTTITELSLRLEELNYPAFQYDGQITSIANLIEAGTGVTITGDGTEASPYIISSGGSQSLAEVLLEGNITDGTDISISDGDKIVLDNGANLKKGTTDAGLGGTKGIALRCAVDYELKWEAGRLYVMGGDGFTIREVSHNFTTTPTVNDDDIKGFVVDSRWILDNGDVYVCTDDTTGAAVWELVNTGTTPSLQQVLDNNHDLVDGNNFQGTGAGTGNSGASVNGFGLNAGYNNSGNEINAFGGNAIQENSGNFVNAFGGNSSQENSGNFVNAFGSSAASYNSGDFVNALGVNAANENTADNLNAFGSNAGKENSGNHVNAFGFGAGESNGFNNVNLFGEGAFANDDNQNVFTKVVDAVTRYFARLSFNDITTDRKWEFPDQDGTIALTSDIPAAGVTSVGLTMPSAFSVTNSPITSSGDIAVTGAGLVSQYIRGDGTLATLPTSASGGSSISYYLNGGTAASVATYFQMSKIAVIGTGVDFSLAGNGLISQWLTDVADPNRLEIPAGNWNFEMYMSASSSGGTPAFYVELLKYDGTTFTTIANSSAIPEAITSGTLIDLYLTSLAIPQTALLVTDRLAIRVYIVNSTGGRTITMHTQDSHLCQIITNFAGGVTSLNGLSANTQYFDVGTGATNFNISSSGDTHTFNLLFNIRRNANNSSNNNINYNGYAVTGSSESSAVWTITRLTIAASGSITTATATNVAWTNRESATYI